MRRFTVVLIGIVSIMLISAGCEGPMGPEGPQGEQGPAGEDGQDGTDGATGPQGPAGQDGQDGADGAPGPEGPQGPAGQDGQDGNANVVTYEFIITHTFDSSSFPTLTLALPIEVDNIMYRTYAWDVEMLSYGLELYSYGRTTVPGISNSNSAYSLFTNWNTEYSGAYFILELVDGVGDMIQVVRITGTEPSEIVDSDPTLPGFFPL